MTNQYDSFNNTLKTATGIADGSVKVKPIEPVKPKKRIPDLRPEDFHWVVYGIGCGILFLLLVCTFVIVRIFDGQWGNWQLPAILAVFYFMVVSVVALVLSIRTVKQEMNAQDDNKVTK